jgi:hypothetical protein
MTGPVREKKPQTVVRAEMKSALSHERKKTTSAPQVAVVKGERAVRGAVAFKAPSGFNTPSPVVKIMPPDVRGPRAPLKKSLTEKIPNAPKRSPRVAKDAVKGATSVKARTKEIFPIFSTWPERPTKADIESVAKYLAGRSEGCID